MDYLHPTQSIWALHVAYSFDYFSGPVGVYTCGPEGLMDDVAAGVARRGKATFLHTETFAL
jgi:hypothetical protein